jgi:hypothetical protein
MGRGWLGGWRPVTVGHWSLFNFRFPQCVSLRSGLNTRSTLRLSARITDAGVHKEISTLSGLD